MPVLPQQAVEKATPTCSSTLGEHRCTLWMVGKSHHFVFPGPLQSVQDLHKGSQLGHVQRRRLSLFLQFCSLHKAHPKPDREAL